MLTIDPRRSLLLIVDFQSRLTPAIHEGASAIRNARRLIDMAELMNIPTVFTEQNARGLGATVAELAVNEARLIHKMTFDAVREPEFLEAVAGERHVIVAGCEAHVCVQQTVLGLLDAKRKVYVVRDALGSRRLEDKETAIRRMERHGAEIVTTEMVVFEWLETAEHMRFREAIALIK
ncbi:isochorismatase family protein [Bradyrhizobium sp. ISRA443]|uniref:isochorismatase family protein n=1 Tax=unclassified Bradyrhizobium TaxID=2631580 RepID=UPI0024784658|nr:MULTISPECIES: isochorismatase family protein [unclassified Bradyrhizobium]WGR95630.1 isochorismatase family protein [Bradyrhizobium sp. ISRA435]WGS00697.1 isochorismatase family protein [Bradyrhizobium sp. ISRA436]WGS07584.1 isochorismatase family protein [Bradyrhizobium sp. ISRA437]WGS14472.1 isochorismatase family protein [Bradyrhizobium sp. ISRA443]